MQSKLFFRKILIGVFGFFWVLFAAEMYLRIYDPQAMLPRYIMATDFGIRGNMPNQDFWHSTPDYRINIKTNSKGIRENFEIPYDKPDDVRRIVILGDSFGVGYGVNLEESLLSTMSKKLDSAGIKNEIINLSVSGFGTAEELIVLEHEGLKYQPDLILVLWHRTDLNDNIRSGLFKIENGTLVRKNKEYLPGVKIREILFSYAVYRWLAGNSHFYNWVRQRVSLIVKKMMLTNKKNENKARSTQDKELNKSPEPALQKTKLNSREKLSIALLNEINKSGLNSGAKMLLLDIPSRISRMKFRSTFPKENINTLDFSVISPMSRFYDVKGALLYWENSHGHFTPEGCYIVGNMLAEHIIDKQLLFDAKK